MNNRVIHFEIHAVEPDKLIKFYSDVFDWKIEELKMPGVKEENRYWSVLTAPMDSKEHGINGGMVIRKGPKPSGGEPVSAFVCTLGVSSVDEYMKKIEEAGGKMTTPKMPIPGMAWLAYGKDPEGNLFGIFEEDKNAK